MRNLLPALALALCLTSLTAQTASFNSYTTPCPSSNPVLSIQGVPKLGTTFTVSSILFPGLCTRKFCGCNIGNCNTCRGSLLVLGIAKINVPLPGGCSLHVSPDFILPGDTRGQITIAVPNTQALLGVKFYMQRSDLGLFEYINAACQKSYIPNAFLGFSNAIEGTIGN